MPVKIVKINSETLPAIADAIRAKTGSTGTILPSQMAGKIASIPTGGELPVLTRPAEVGHVVAGREYINAAGNKQTGTMVVCDSVGVSEAFGEAGVGLHVEIESTVDGSIGVLTLPEQNISSDNIKSGVNIFGIAGNAKTLRVKTGTITPAEDTLSLTIPEQRDGARGIVVFADNQTALESKGADSIYSFRAIIAHARNETTDIIGTMIRYTGASYSYTMTGVAKSESGEVNIVGSTGRYFRAGIVYRYYVYYWEDNE